jgi:hypothetical protein
MLFPAAGATVTAALAACAAVFVGRTEVEIRRARRTLKGVGGCDLMEMDVTNMGATLGVRLTDMLVDAATVGQGMWGRGVLCVRCDGGSLAWTYKPLAECTEEIDEWAELQALLPTYDLKREVVVALFDDGAEFFQLPVRQH